MAKIPVYSIPPSGAGTQADLLVDRTFNLSGIARNDSTADNLDIVISGTINKYDLLLVVAEGRISVTATAAGTSYGYLTLNSTSYGRNICGTSSSKIGATESASGTLRFPAMKTEGDSFKAIDALSTFVGTDNTIRLYLHGTYADMTASGRIQVWGVKLYAN